MKKYVLLILLLVSGPSLASVENLPDRLSAVRSELLNSEPLATYDFRQLQSRFPNSLLLPSSLLPQSAAYPLKSLKRLYTNAITCKGPWPVSPLVTQPVVFTRAICNNTVLPKGWFVRSGYIHPGGGSYADRYLEKHPEKETGNSVKIWETGTARGFSSLCMSKALSDQKCSGTILTFDLLPHQTKMYWNCIDDQNGPLTRAELLKPWQNLVERYIIFHHSAVGHSCRRVKHVPYRDCGGISSSRLLRPVGKISRAIA